MGKGFSLTELLMITVVLLLVAIGAVSIYLLSYTSWREAMVQVALQRKASIAMDRMVHGIRGKEESRRNGLREASAFSIPTSNEIRFTSGVDNLERRFFLTSNKELIYVPSVGAEEKVAKAISSLSFERYAVRRIRINISSQEQMKGKTIDITLKTEVMIRN